VDDLNDAQKIDFNMSLKSKGLNKLVSYLFDSVPNKQKHRTHRQHLRDSLRIILMNLISTDGYISYKRDKHAPEYKVKKYSAKNVCTVVDFLSSNEFIESRPGYFFKQDGICKTSKIKCQKKLREMFDDYQVKQCDIQLKPQTDLIILRDNTKQSIPFIDTDFTLSAKENLKKVNGLLSRHSIILPSSRPLIHKAMHRVFNTDFEHGGRFYGPEWQSLNEISRSRLEIDNAPVVELDFDNYHPTILYAQRGLEPNGDLYNLSGYSEDYRGLIKRITFMLLNTGDKEKTRKSVQWEINRRNIKPPPGLSSIREMVDAVMVKHEAIADMFNKDIGKRLQRLDADISEDIFTYFSGQDVPILGVHDSFIIDAKNEEKLREVMKEVFFNKFKTVCHVSKKGKKKV